MSKYASNFLWLCFASLGLAKISGKVTAYNRNILDSNIMLSANLMYMTYKSWKLYKLNNIFSTNLLWLSVPICQTRITDRSPRKIWYQQSCQAIFQYDGSVDIKHITISSRHYDKLASYLHMTYIWQSRNW